MRFDTIILRSRELPNADKLLVALVERGIDIVCVAGEGTADPGFMVQRAAKVRDDKILVIPGAVVLGSNNLHILVVGVVERVTIPAINDTATLTTLVRAHGGATVALHPSALIDTPGWALIDSSVVWHADTLYPRTVPVMLAITGYGGPDEIGRVYTDILADGIESYCDLTNLMITHPEKFVPVILKSGAAQ